MNEETSPNPYAPNPYATGAYAQYGAPDQPPQWSGGITYSDQPKRFPAAWIAGGAALVVLVVVGVVAAVHVFNHRTDAAKAAATTYLTDLQTGQYDAAYQMLCSSDRLIVAEQTFVTAKSGAHPVSFSLRHAYLHHSNGLEYVDVTYDETRTDGWNGPGIVRVIHYGGQWEVCHAGMATDWLG